MQLTYRFLKDKPFLQETSRIFAREKPGICKRETGYLQERNRIFAREKLVCITDNPVFEHQTIQKEDYRHMCLGFCRDMVSLYFLELQVSSKLECNQPGGCSKPVLLKSLFLGPVWRLLKGTITWGFRKGSRFPHRVYRPL